MTKNIEHYTYLFHERAGIIENDGISKEQANKTALSEIKWRYQKENNLDIKNPLLAILLIIFLGNSPKKQWKFLNLVLLGSLIIKLSTRILHQEELN
jgi:hypothetical protein